MKNLFTIILLTLLSTGCHAIGSKSTSNPQVKANFDSKNSRTFVWAETGLAFTLLQGWHRDDDGEDDEGRSWVGPGNSKFSVSVHVYQPEHGNRSIEDETNDFYEDHKRSGEEDLRYLEIDGVRGVHYLRDEKGWDQNYQPQDEKFIIWNAQRMYKGARHIINARVSSPTNNFTKDRDTLYALLQSIKFTQNDGGTLR